MGVEMMLVCSMSKRNLCRRTAHALVVQNGIGGGKDWVFPGSRYCLWEFPFVLQRKWQTEGIQSFDVR